MLEKPIEIKDKDEHIICNWLAGAKLNIAGYVDIEIYSGLKPYLLKLQQEFTKYKLKNILFLHSAYSIRIYELLKQFENTKIKQISIVEFREILKIPKSYQTKHLKPYILEPAKKELSEKTDIKFTYELKKEGRRFKTIIFNIEHNEKNVDKKPIKQLQKQQEEKHLSMEDLAKECYEKNLIEDNCQYNISAFNPPFCKYCKAFKH